MEIPLDKAIPRVLALALVGYCLWPSFSEFLSSPKAKKPKKTPELTVAMLSPELPPPLTRDPFEEGTTALASTVKKEMPSTTKAAVELSADAKQEKPAMAKTRQETEEQRIVKRAPPDKKSSSHRIGNAEPLNLEATCIVDDQRLAVISGRIYGTDDTLLLPGLSTTPCKIVEVLPYRVVLKCGNKNFELQYSDMTPKSPSSIKKSRSKTKSKTRRTKNATQKRPPQK